MRRAAALLLTLALAGAALAAPQARMDQPRMSTLAAGDGATVLRAEFPVRVAPADWTAVPPAQVEWPGARDVVDDGLNPAFELPVSVGAAVALPARAAPRVRVSGWTWLREPDAPVDVAAQVDLGAVRVLRGVPMVSVSVRPETPGGGLLATVDVRLEHAPTGDYAAALAAQPAGAALKSGPRGAPGRDALANPDLYDRLHDGLAAARSAAAKELDGQAFTLSDHWLRLEVTETGVYRLTGAQTEVAGLNPQLADPATFRLFRAWPEALPLDPEADGSWQAAWDGLTETAMDLGSTGAAWDATDELRFYGVGPDTWSDRIDPAAGRLEHQNHPFSNATVYWLTWEEFGTASPFAGAPARVAAQALPAHGLTPVADHLKRVHLEEQVVEAHGYVEDGWVWSSAIANTRTVSFNAADAVAGSPVFFDVGVSANYKEGDSNGNLAASVWLNGQTSDAATTEWSIATQDDSLRIRVTGWRGPIVRGNNTLTLSNIETGAGYNIMLDSVELLYRSELAKTGGMLFFTHWGDEVATAGTPMDLTLAIPAGRNVTIWDVTDPASPVAVTGSSGTGGATLGLTRDPSSDRHFLAFESTDLLSTASRTLRTPGVLRTMDQDVDMVILYGEGLSAPAARLRDHRADHLPGVAAPRVVAIAAEDVYESFGGAVTDPLALRNFLKWVWQGGEGRLRSVCFLGDASRDPRDYRGIFPGRLPTWLSVMFPRLLTSYLYYPYATDDMLVSFDTPPASIPDAPDLACGRLTVRDLEEALDRVDRIIDFDDDLPEGAWRNRVVLAADDLTQPSYPDGFERAHQDMAEELADAYIPDTIDISKVYLLAYPAASGSHYKPLARQAAREAWNQGLTIFHYIGHGSDDVLADEQLFLTDDIYALNNGERRGLFLAFSCDVGIYDQVTKQSLAESFVSQERGGAIAAIAASQVSWVGPNNLITRAFYSYLFPGRVVDATQTLGEALWLGKIRVWEQYPGVYQYVANSQRYTLLGDPELSLPHPAGGHDFATASLDTLRGGRRQEAVFVLPDHGLAPGAGVTYDLLVEESRKEQTYQRAGDTRVVEWWEEGSAAFHGTGTALSDTLRIPFKTPLQLRYGNHGKVRLIVTPETGDAVAAALTVPVVQAATGVTDDVAGPSIALAFADNRYRVKPGTELTAVLQDTSGVSILGTNPLNSVLLEFDGTGVMSDVSDAFEFEPGSYTVGRLSVPVPDDLATGDHRVALFASDVLGNVGSDTLSFKLVAGGVAEIADATVWPNPTPGPTNLVFELSDPMEVTWSIYTVSGHRIWTATRDFPDGGPQTMAWDGRDAEGDEVANGVYLYVLKGDWADDGHPVTVTGQVVKMK